MWERKGYSRGKKTEEKTLVPVAGVGEEEESAVGKLLEG